MVHPDSVLTIVNDEIKNFQDLTVDRPAKTDASTRANRGWSPW